MSNLNNLSVKKTTKTGEAFKKFEKQLVEAGTHLGVLLHIINLGEVSTGKFGKKNRVLLTFELPNQLITSGPSKGLPMVISQEVNAILTSPDSQRTSDLRRYVNALSGKITSGNPDFTTLVGKGLLLTVIHKENNGKTYANIIGSSALEKGREVPELVNESFVLLDTENPDEDTLKRLSESPMKWVLNKINFNRSSTTQTETTSDSEDF